MQGNLKFPRWLLFVITSSALIFAVYSDSLYANSFRKLFINSKLDFGGWIHGGATLNPSQTNGFNGPVIFADQANRFQLNQFNLFLRRPVVSEGRVWDFGGRFDFMFGTDAIFTQAFGVPAFDVNTGEPLERSTWDLHLCCASTKTYGIALP